MARRWNPFTRWRRTASATQALASTPAAIVPALLVLPDPPDRLDPPAFAATLPPTALAGAGAGAGAGAAEAEAEVEVESPEQRRVRFFCWLLDVTPAAAATPAAADLPGLFEQLDPVIGSQTLRAALLPRAPHVVPQLMKTLRDESYSSADVATKISKDVVLTAEVVRSATSAFQRSDGEAGEIDLAHAVAMIGTQGLRRAIASVVLRPIFDARGDSLSARAAAQIWKNADAKARLCSVLAAQSGLDPFDGYLAGLLHNSGWTALLRAIDGLPITTIRAGDLAHPEVVPQLLRRRDTLFGGLVGSWKLGPAMDALAGEVGGVGLEAAQSPLGTALRDAARLAAWHVLAASGERPVASGPIWAALPAAVQNCYATLPPD